MTPQYILRKSLCRPAHCFSAHVPGQGYVNDGSRVDLRPEYDRQRIHRATVAIENLDCANGYAEPGYSDPDRGVLFADWNIFPRGVDTVLERAGYAIEWQDEWATCADCNKAVRTSPDSYSWQPYYLLVNDCEIVCLDCIDWPDYLESIQDSGTAVPAECDPSAHGYDRLSDPDAYASGLHPGQTDDPSAILASLQASGYTGVIFRVSDTRQFDCAFETWIARTDPDTRLTNAIDHLGGRWSQTADEATDAAVDLLWTAVQAIRTEAV